MKQSEEQQLSIRLNHALFQSKQLSPFSVFLLHFHKLYSFWVSILRHSFWVYAIR